MTPTEQHTPGAYTPKAGTFVCDCSSAHLWRIDIAGHLFPAFPPGCSGRSWREQDATAPEPAGTEADPLL
ncbi:hypothetical protein ACIGW4_14950 [Streptomyces sp. NPDC053513]|uniref:Uncharacterized protein n=1 Tax=Streptomyces litmocidini TaxID=67318 RepID=A0ABW7TXG9_9ACTN